MPSARQTTRTPAFCTQCRSRCGCTAVVEDGRLIRIEELPGHPTGDKLCPKGRAAPELVYHPDRLMQPLRRTAPKGAADPGWRPISWDAALGEIAGHMRRIERAHGPEQVAFSVTTPSGSHISDSIAWIERLIRAYGSPNTIYGTEICNWHKDFASRFTYGTDIGTPDFANTGCVLLWGNNPAATWLARATEAQKAVRRGARLIVVDPRPTAFAKRADTGRFLRQSDLEAGGRGDVLYARAADDGALIAYDAGRGAWLDPARRPELRGGQEVRIDTGTVACRTAFEELAAAAADYPPERVAAVTGVDAAALANAAATLGSAPSVAYYAWNGVGQSVTATQTDRAISILYALTGSYGRQGGNVPGGAAPFRDLSGHDLLSPAQKAKALGLAERPRGPGLMGYVTAGDVYRAVLEGAPYPVRMLVSFGTNLLASRPDADMAERALRALEHHVHVDFFLNPTAQWADIVLPAATSWEREGLRPGFDGSLAGLSRVQLRPAVIAPLGQARSDTDIVLDLAARLGLSEAMLGGDADRGHDWVLEPAGLSVAALREAPEGVGLAASVPLDAHRQPVDGVARGFPTPTRRVEIYSERLQEHGYAPVPRFAAEAAEGAVRPPAGYPLRLGSAKLVAYCHSQHRNIAALRRLAPDPALEMHPDDAAARGIGDGDWVRIRTAAGAAVARARLVAELAPGTVFGQHGWWVDGPPGSPYDAALPLAASFNRLVDTTRTDPISGSIPLRASWCEVERHDGAPAPG